MELPFDKAKSQRRAFGFITFESEEVVDNICSTPKIPFRDKMVMVCVCVCDMDMMIIMTMPLPQCMSNWFYIT